MELTSDFPEGELKERLNKLQLIIRSLDSALIAFSGGVDSTLLLYVTHRVLMDRVMAVIAYSPIYPEKEIQEARKLLEDWKIRYCVISSKEMEDECFVSNPPERCYYCKDNLFQDLWSMAHEKGYRHVLDGSNYDDLKDYRPGMEAGNKLQVRSPLQEAGLTKQDIREISRFFYLPTSEKPAMACLASRFPYGVRLEVEQLKQVELAESYLYSLGFQNSRVRHHNRVARIEIPEEEMPRLLQVKDRVVNKLKESGYYYVTLDLQGFRSGSMNEVLEDDQVST